MNTTRRRLIAGTGTAGLVGLAGCAGIDTGFITGDDAAEFAATPATVADATLEETEYELNQLTEEVITREFEAGGQTRDVEVTNHQAEYDRSVEILGTRYQAAVFTVLSTPQVTVLGRTFNPVGDMDRDDLAEMIQERYDQIENVELESEYSMTLLGRETSIGQYSADGRLADTDVTVDLAMHISDPIEVGDDFVIGLGAYPKLLGGSDAVRKLFAGIEHEAQ